MWAQILAFVVKRPWILVIVALLAVTGVQWTKIQFHKGEILDLKEDIVEIQRDYKTCKVNEVSLNDAIDVCNTEHDEFVANIDLLGEQVRTEKERVVEWRDKYLNHVCYDPNTDTVTVTPDERRVLNDEKNTDAINRINDLFQP
jgi:hypothetical protein